MISYHTQRRLLQDIIPVNRFCKVYNWVKKLPEPPVQAGVPHNPRAQYFSGSCLD